MKNAFITVLICIGLIISSCGESAREHKNDTSQDTLKVQRPTSTAEKKQATKDSVIKDSGAETLPKKPEQP